MQKGAASLGKEHGILHLCKIWEAPKPSQEQGQVRAVYASSLIPQVLRGFLQ